MFKKWRCIILTSMRPHITEQDKIKESSVKFYNKT